MRITLTTRGILLFAFFSPLSVLFGQIQFIPMGYLDGYGPTSEANAITRDGNKAVGYSTTSLTANQACFWTTAGISNLPGMQNWYANAAYAISADGNVIVGDRSFGGTEEAFYWTPAGQIQLVPFSIAQKSSTAKGITGNGQIIVGTAVSTNTLQAKAFRWDRSQSTAVFLPPYPPSTVPNGAALAVSDDGSRVVGAVQTGLSTYAAARWDNGGNPVLLSQVGDAVIAVTANAISPDGSIIVGSGYVSATGKSVGFKWTAAGGVVALTNPTTGVYAIDAATAKSISGDGRVIVGYGVNVAGDDEAIFWVNGLPYRVSDVALFGGVLPPSWETHRAYGVDYFGNKICGYGRATSGKLEAYLLVIDATPPTPPLVAPTIRSAFSPGTGMSVHYPTVPGLNYRMRGGTNLQSLAPLGGWSAGLGFEQEFPVTSGVTGGANKFFLRLEAAIP